MKKQSLINIGKTNLRLRMMAGLKGFQEVEIPEIPKEWTKFLDTEDEWCGIVMPNSENSSACLFKGKEKSVFDPHTHAKEKEHLTVMNEGGSFKIFIEDYGTYTVEYPDSIVVPAGVTHAVIFNTNTVVSIIWHPKFKKGWNAKFKEEAK